MLKHVAEVNKIFHRKLNIPIMSTRNYIDQKHIKKRIKKDMTRNFIKVQERILRHHLLQKISLKPKIPTTRNS